MAKKRIIKRMRAYRPKKKMSWMKWVIIALIGVVALKKDWREKVIGMFKGMFNKNESAK